MARVVYFLGVLAVLAVLFVLFSCSLSLSPLSDNLIYVSTSGSDGNDGLSPSKPVRSLVKAVSIAKNIDPSIPVEIKVTSGIYSNGNGLNSDKVGVVIDRHNITISGGWNSDFTSIVGKSELNGNRKLYHIVKVGNVTNIFLMNLLITGGNANGSSPDDKGGGIYASNVSYFSVGTSVVVSNNTASDKGGGIYLVDSQNNTISGLVILNIASAGGGICLESSKSNLLIGGIAGNGATTLLNQGKGGGACFISSPYNVFGSVALTNFANMGGGVYLDNSDYFTNDGWITNNNATIKGGGVYTNNPHPHSYFGDGTVINNSPDNFNIN
jgi:parallel beta-helix repeat protein